MSAVAGAVREVNREERLLLSRKGVCVIMKRCLFPVLFSVLFLSVCPALPVPAAELVTIRGVTLMDAGLNDGDSFTVKAGGRALVLRLYFVDCPETAYGSNIDRERIREQQDHFGLQDPRAVVRFGARAAEYTKRALSRPFTIYTSHAKAPGRTATGRVYAFVKTRDGRDLAHMLVQQGLARIHGKTRPSPGGLDSDLVLEELQDLRVGAVLNREGIWAESDPDVLAERRKARRKKQREDVAFGKQFAPSTDNPLCLNSASKKQLESIAGVGPVTANKIIANRPWRSVDGLMTLQGIGPKKLRNIKPYVTVDCHNDSRRKGQP